MVETFSVLCYGGDILGPLLRWRHSLSSVMVETFYVLCYFGDILCPLLWWRHSKSSVMVETFPIRLLDVVLN
jgi:uncharacterized Tic20 family protein